MKKYRKRADIYPAPGMKECAKCRVVKPFSDYSKRGDGSTIMHCKPCKAEIQRHIRRKWEPICTPEQAAEFDAKLDKTHPSGCWIWTGYVRAKDGYGQLSFAGRTMTAHQAAMLIDGRWPPSGLVIDHKCRNLLCANPAHLRLVTVRENTLFNNSNTWALNYAKTHCVHGHEFTEDNIYRQKPGTRNCRACTILHARAAAIAKRLGLPPRDEQFK